MVGANRVTFLSAVLNPLRSRNVLTAWNWHRLFSPYERTRLAAFPTLRVHGEWFDLPVEIRAVLVVVVGGWLVVDDPCDLMGL